MEEIRDRAYEFNKVIDGDTTELYKINKELRQKIAELRKSEDKLRKSEKRFRRLFEYIPDAIFLFNLHGDIIDINKRACDNLGYSRDELISLSIKDIEKEFYMTNEQIDQLKNGEHVIIEGFQKRKDHTSFPMEAHLWAFELDGEELILALVRDMTHLKRAEEENFRLAAQLSYAQRIKSIGTLAGGIAHNFNNLLMGIQGNTSLMLIDKTTDDIDYEKLMRIQKLIDNGAILTGQLMEYAREGTYRIRPSNLNKIIRETSNIFGASRKEISLHYDLADDLSGVEIDENQFQQAFMNILINAADAMPEGGNIFLKTRNVSHRVMIDKPYNPSPGQYVMLTVTDSGLGMDKNSISRAFDPFFTTKGMSQRTGLGLASAYGIIKGHGGFIDIDSEKGQGTTISIYIPTSGDEVKPTGDILMGKGTILFIDDEEIVLETGEQMIERIGYNVLTAESGKKAIEILEKKHNDIDVVLLDLIMPEMGGGATFDRIKEINPDIKVLLSSGYSLDGEAEKIMKRGCNGFIQKPFNIKSLSQKLADILEQ